MKGNTMDETQKLVATAVTVAAGVAVLAAKYARVRKPAKRYNDYSLVRLEFDGIDDYK
jgi:hypothetical protein